MLALASVFFGGNQASNYPEEDIMTTSETYIVVIDDRLEAEFPELWMAQQYFADCEGYPWMTAYCGPKSGWDFDLCQPR